MLIGEDDVDLRDVAAILNTFGVVDIARLGDACCDADTALDCIDC